MGKEAVSWKLSCTKWPIFSAAEQLAKTLSIGRTSATLTGKSRAIGTFAVTERFLMEMCSPTPWSPSPTENAAARARLADPGDVSEAVLVARVAEQLELRAGRLERDARRRDAPLDDILEHDLVEVEPFRRAELLDRLRVVVDEGRLLAVCVSVWGSRRLVTKKRTVARR